MDVLCRIGDVLWKLLHLWYTAFRKLNLQWMPFKWNVGDVLFGLFFNSAILIFDFEWRFIQPKRLLQFKLVQWCFIIIGFLFFVWNTFESAGEDVKSEWEKIRRFVSNWFSWKINWFFSFRLCQWRMLSCAHVAVQKVNDPVLEDSLWLQVLSIRI